MRKKFLYLINIWQYVPCWNRRNHGQIFISINLLQMPFVIKFINSEKSQKFCTTVHTVKGKGKILQTFVAFSEYMNFMYIYIIVGTIFFSVWVLHQSFRETWMHEGSYGKPSKTLQMWKFRLWQSLWNCLWLQYTPIAEELLSL